MMTLAALDLSILTEGLQRRLAAKNRAALDDLAAAVQSAERYRAQTANSSRAAPRPGHDGRPDTGPRAPAPGEKSRADDELRVKRAVAAKGSVSQTDVSAHAPAAVAHTARPSSPALGGRVPATGAAIASVRSALIAKANLAAGSQAAVVKIASFGSGAARAKSLLNYQSDKGELTLERHDGLMITGQRSVADFAATWRAEDGRAPSNDVLQFEMRFDRRLETTEAQDALAMQDSKMLETLSRSKKGGEFALRLQQRRLYKKAHSLPAAKLGMKQHEAEGLLSEKCGCSVLIDIPRLSLAAHIRLDINGKKLPLASKSEIVASLQKMQDSRLDALVICEERFVKKVATAAQRLL